MIDENEMKDSFELTNDDIERIINEMDNNDEEEFIKNRIKETQSIEHAKEFVAGTDITSIKDKMRKNQYLTMEEKTQLMINGEQVPICVGKSSKSYIGFGPVKCYSLKIDKKMKL